MEKQVERSDAARPRVGFIIHLAAFVIVNALLVTLNWLTSPEQLWFQWPLLGWGLGILLHAALVLYLPKRPGGGQRRLAVELRKKPRNRRRSHAR